MSAAPFRSVLFICYGNACRSPMAEAIARRDLPGVAVASAGLVPLGFVPDETTRALVEAGYDASGLESKPVDDALLAAADLVVDLCGDWVPPRGFAKQTASWPVEDPYRKPFGVWRATRDDLVARIGALARGR